MLWAVSRSPTEMADAVAAHRGVLAAVEARDAGLARALTEAHVDTVTHRLIDLHVRLTRGARVSAAPDRERSDP